MTVYVDAPRAFAHKRKKYSHLMADTTDELHKFASVLGVKQHWFDRDHYDLSPEQFHDAVLAGAIVVTSRELVRIRQDRRKK